MAALVALLVVAFRHTPARVEAGVGVLAALVCLSTAASSWPQAYDALLRILPVVVFLVAILVVAGACAELGLFRAIGQRIGRGGADGGAGPVRFLTLTFVAAVLITAVLSLDATVVLLTPVVLAAALSAGVLARPGLSACVRLANSSSLLLPVSNLTTLLAIRVVDLSFVRFALVMAPAWLAVIGVEYAAHRWFFRRDLAEPGRRPAEAGEVVPLPRLPLVVVALMLLGFAATSSTGLGAAWGAAVVALVAAVVLLLVSGVRRPRSTPRILLAGQPGFAVYVLGLAVVVDAVARGGLGDLVARIVPGTADGADALLTLIWLAVLATVLANVVNNLPATLLLLPIVGPLGTLPVLATLIGLNVGSSLTWTGSLANLLWRRTLTTAGARPSSRDYHRVSVVTVPAAVLVGVLLTWAWSGLII